MTDFVLPNYVELPKVEVIKSGNWRKDIGETITRMAEHFDDQARVSAMRNVFGYVGPKEDKPLYEDPNWPGVAASVLRQLVRVMEGST